MAGYICPEKISEGEVLERDSKGMLPLRRKTANMT
jgi:hypothetical protein